MNTNSRIKPFKDASSGILKSFASEFHFKIHAIVTLLVLLFAFYVQVTMIELSIILLLIGLVFITELINTAIEKLCDFIHPEYEERIGLVKDIAAGAVLMSAFTAAIIGSLLLLPYLLK